MDYLEQYPLRAENIIWRMIDREAVLLSEDGRQIHMLNKVATTIWRLANGEARVKDILATMIERFEVQPEVAEKDLQDFMEQLVAKGLVKLNDTPAAERGALKNR